MGVFDSESRIKSGKFNTRVCSMFVMLFLVKKKYGAFSRNIKTLLRDIRISI